MGVKSEYKEVKIGTKGLNYFDDPLTMPKEYSPELCNVIIVNNQIRKRYGYRALGTKGLPFSGVGMKIYNFVDNDGESKLLGFSSGSVYVFNESSGEWEDLDTGTGEPATYFWTLDETQVLTNRVSLAVVSDIALFDDSITALAISNGNDLPFGFDGTSLVALHVESGDDNAKGIADFTDCQELESLNDHMFVINFSASVDYRRGLYYSVAGEINNFTDIGSGFQVIADSVGQLVCAKKLENNLVLYSDYSISVCRYIGGDIIFIFPTYIQELGIWSPNAIHATAKFHYFIASDGRIYTYAGTNLLTPIGTLVESVFYDNMNVDKRFLTNLSYDFARKHLYFFAVKKGADYPNYYLALDTQRGAWLTGEFTHSCMSMCSWNNTQSDASYFDDADIENIPAIDANWFADKFSVQSGYPTTIFISDNGYVYEIVNNLMTDNGSNFPAYVSTGDISVVESTTENYGRVITLVLEASSGNYSTSVLQIQYSTDGGRTWIELDNLRVYSDMDKYHISMDALCRKIRFRVGFIKHNNDAEEDFVIASLGLWTVEGKEH